MTELIDGMVITDPLGSRFQINNDGCRAPKLNKIKIALWSPPDFNTDINDFSEETVIDIIGDEVEAFDLAFQEKYKNDALTTNEKLLLKTYLWWRTKSYARIFRLEQDGLSIDDIGTVRLIAAEMMVSFVALVSGDRINNNAVSLTKRGREAHDILVRKWEEWKERSEIILYETTATHRGVVRKKKH
jgi:hypothetical protein